MFDLPIDSLYVWTGLSLIGVVLTGVAVELPTEPAPNAASVADAVDAVAASPYPSTATHPTGARAVRIGPRQIAVKSPDGQTHATLAHGPVVPVRDGDLSRVLAGVPPDDLFGSPRAFGRAARAARNRTPTWRAPGGEVVVRKVTWGGVNVTLVGA